jgi:hypothetical protein
VLIVFPVLPERHYILQAILEEVSSFPNMVKLRYQDPRYDVRRQLQPAAPISLHLAPEAMVNAITQQQVQIVREIVLSAGKEQNAQEGHIADLLYDAGTLALSPYMRGFDTSPPLVCGLKDISLGGACLTLEEAHEPEALMHRLILLNIPLPCLVFNNISLQLLLKPFGIIRNVRTTVEPSTLHIRFLKRLPRELTALFECLERRFLEQPSAQPLGAQTTLEPCGLPDAR